MLRTIRGFVLPVLSCCRSWLDAAAFQTAYCLFMGYGVCTMCSQERIPAFFGAIGFTVVILWANDILEEESPLTVALWALGILLVSFLFLCLLYSLAAVGEKRLNNNDG